MKLVLMLVAIYSLIFHQLSKEEKSAINSDHRLREMQNNIAPSGRPEEDNGNGFLFSSHLIKTPASRRISQISPARAMVIQYPFYKSSTLK